MEFPGVSRIMKESIRGAWDLSVNDVVSTKMIKSQLFQMAEEQERAWMNMKYTVDELERRLRILEIEKAQFEDILQLRMIARTVGAVHEDSDGSSVEMEDSLVDYNSFYVSKIFEDRQVGNECGKPYGKRLQRQLTFYSEVADEQGDLTWQVEAQRLRREVSRLEEELRLATQQQVSVDVLYDAPEEMSDGASSSQASEASTTHEGLRRGDFDYGESATFSGQLSESFLRHTSILEDIRRSLKQRGGNSDMLTVEDSVMDLLTELSRQLARSCTTLQADLQSAAHNMPPWVNSLENAMASLKENATFTGEARSQATDISELEGKVKAQACHLTEVLDKHAAELQRKDNTIKYAQELNMQLATDLTRLESELADVRSQNKGLQASMEVPSKGTRYGPLVQSEVAKSEAKLLGLERMLADKDSQLQEVRRRLHSTQSETDATAIEKIDLLQKLRDLRKEADGHKERVQELVTINKEALQFAESKEEEAARLQPALTGCEQRLQGMTESCSRLSEELNQAKKHLGVAEDEREKDREEHNAVKERLKEMEYEMRQREAALERLTKHLASLVRDSDALHSSSLRFQHGARHNNSREKDNKAVEQKRQSKVVIRDLEEKLGSMERLESEFSKVRIQMAGMKLDGNLVPHRST